MARAAVLREIAARVGPACPASRSTVAASILAGALVYLGAAQANRIFVALMPAQDRWDLWIPVVSQFEN